MELQILSSDKIDKTKWDECLYNSTTSLIYASSAYLDLMTDNWDGIVAGDYEYIMPVPWRKKFGIKYCYDVPFIQQLGVYGKTVAQKETDIFLKTLKENFKYGDYAFNFSNKIVNGIPNNNYMLSLASNYRSISFFYSDKLKADLTKAQQNNLEYSHANFFDVISTFKELYSKKISSVKENDYKNFSHLCEIKEKENALIARKTSFDAKAIGMVLLLKDKHRLYNLMSCTTPQGRNMLAGHLLYDNLIKEFSQTGLVLDFEGSEMQGIAHFYKSFGAILQAYHKIHINRLPLFLKLFKR